MKRRTLLLSLASICMFSAKAQVDDVSIFVTPIAGYNWFDNKSTIENGASYGFQAGFGFGRVLELRGIYERSLNLKQNFGKYEGDIQNLFPNFSFSDRSIDVRRIGGEFKTNIPVSNFSPYLILGTGVQKFSRDLESGSTYKNENLYGSGGLGFKINMGNRTTFNIEGRGIVYNMDPGSLLYNEGGETAFDDWVNSHDRSRMFNWSLMAGLQFYFGGRNEEDLSALDKAYLRRFSGGVSGTKVTLSPAGAYMNFNSNTGFRDTYMLGGMLGIDFTNYVGLQGYYYRATENKEISLDFDKLSMYGADFVGKLNVPRGIVPYVSIGGGYLNVQDSYEGTPVYGSSGDLTGFQPTNSSYYAKGGLGVILPLSKYVQVFGAANLLYTMDDKDADVTKLQNTDELSRHTMYNAGLRFNFGKKADTDRQVERSFNRRFADERSDYDARISILEEELKEAYKNNDAEKAVKIIEEKKAVDSGKSVTKGLTQEDVDNAIKKALEEKDKKDKENMLQNRLDRLENLMIMNNQNQFNRSSRIVTDTVVVRANTVGNSEESLRSEIEKLNKQLEMQRRIGQQGESKSGEEISNVDNEALVKEVQRLSQQVEDQRKSLQNVDVKTVNVDNNNEALIKEIQRLSQQVERQRVRVQSVDSKSQVQTVNTENDNLAREIQRLNKQLADQHKTLQNTEINQTRNATEVNSNISDELLKELQRLNRQVEDQRRTIQDIQQNDVARVPEATVQYTEPQVQYMVRGNLTRNTGYLGLSPYIAANFGDASTFNIGARAIYGFERTSIMFTPEAYIAIGNGGGFGLSANAILPLYDKSDLKPYAGLGLGMHSLGGNFRLNTNVIMGAAYQYGRGSILADYTIRGGFKNNQIAIGYRFGF